MKKVLTLLLTIVMAVCLINFNNNHTKADDESNGDQYVFNLKTNGYLFEWKYQKNGGAETSVPITGQMPLNAGDVVTFYNNSTYYKLNIIINKKDFELSNGQSSEPYTVVNNNAKIYGINNDLRPVLVDYEDTPIECSGIKFDGTKWFNGNTELDGTTEDKKLSHYGIEYTAGTAKLTKNLVCTTSSSTLNIQGDLIVEIMKNISLISTTPYRALSISKNDAYNDVSFKSNGSTLTLISSNATNLLHYGGNLSLDNIIIDVYSNKDSASESAVGLYWDSNPTGDMNLINDSKIIIRSSKASGALCTRLTQLPLPSTYKVYGSESLTDLTLKEAKPIGTGLQKYYVNVDGTDVIAKYVVIEPNHTPVPSPTPSPSKKDESCEKVIGPTWHWNNTKGICEEYTTVGTSTRGIDSK